MITWTEFGRRQPVLADAGRRQFYQYGIGLAFLATIRPDGGPRLHPVCPVVSPAGLHLLIKAGPKQQDLRRDRRYALHSETCPPPRQDDGFAVTGHAAVITERDTWQVVRDQVIADFGQLWPDYDSFTLFELSLASCLLTLTQPDGTFPKGATVWKA